MGNELRAKGTVYVVDDIASMRIAFQGLLDALGYKVETFKSGVEFLKKSSFDYPSCAIIDLAMPVMSGLQVQVELKKRGCKIPAMLLTAHESIETCSEALGNGALRYLEKGKVKPQEIVVYVEEAMRESRRMQEELTERKRLRDRIDRLSQRQWQVLEAVVQGLPNKVIASGLNINEGTVKAHRSQMMRKMQVNNPQDLVRILKIPHTFISYVSEDAEAVDKLGRELKGHGINLWVDRDRLLPGQLWKQRIKTAIQEGAFFIACFSPHFVSRERTYMREELFIAIEELRRRPAERAWFVPVLLSSCELPDLSIGRGQTLRDLQWVDLSMDWDRSVMKILRVLEDGISA